MATSFAKGNSSEKFSSGHSNNMANGEVSQDMHLKMSKKIAQLTKVIYALNTRSDEHETIVDKMKDVHEREMGQLLVETKEKLSHYQSLIGKDLEYKRKITCLEECVNEHERQQKEFKNEFENLRDDAERREQDLIRDHNARVSELSRELNEIRRSYEKAVAKFEALSGQMELEKTAALELQRENYESKINDLLRDKQDMQSNLSGAAEQLHANYRQEADDLRSQLDRMKADRQRADEDNLEKLQKAAALHQRELEALNSSQSKEADERSSGLQKSLDDLKKEHYQMLASNKKRVEDLTGKVAISEDTIGELKSRLKTFEKSENSSHSELKKLQKDIEDRQGKIDKLTEELRSIRIELITLQENNKQQSSDIMKKSELIGNLQATVMQHESTIQSTKQELDKLRDKLKTIEKKKRDVESASKNQSSELDSKVKHLEDRVDDLLAEKEDMKQRYERDIGVASKEAANREVQLRQSLELEHKKARDKADKAAASSESRLQEKITALTKEYEEKLEAEITKTKSSTAQFKVEMDKLRKELTNKIKQAEKETARLQQLMNEKESGLGTANSQLVGLQNSNKQLAEEAAQLREEARVCRAQTTAHKADLDKLKTLYEGLQKEARVDLNDKLSELSAELDKKWSETLRRECGRLRTELGASAAADKKAALEQLARLKEEELARVKASVGMRTEETECELRALRDKVAELEAARRKDVEKANRNFAEEMGKMREALRDTEAQRERDLKSLKERYESEMSELKERLRRNLQESNKHSESKTRDEIASLQANHEAAIEKTKQDAEKTRLRHMDELSNRMTREKEELRADLMVQFSGEIDQHSSVFKDQLKAIEREKEELKEQSRKKELELTNRINSLKADLASKDQAMKRISAELERVKVGMGEMSRELDNKGREVLQARSEATNKIKKRESDLNNQYEEEMRRLKSSADTDTQRLLENFNEAQHLLKDKISELTVLLEESEDRYRLRESRTEDLEMIEELKASLATREREMLRLIEEKKFYQMELVNRETNFNKVFNTAPQVGVMNPLTTVNTTGVKKKTSIDKGSNKTQQRLAPLPNSPFHDDIINPSKPLPPPSKKFMA